MTGDPTHVLWWLVSRAAGIVAIALISISVMLGLLMAARLIPGRHKRFASRLHEHLALIALAAVAVHGAALLGDGWLAPGLSGITVPFALHYRPPFTAAGILAGYLALLVGPSFYLRRRIGARRWRSLHRAASLVWLLGAVHALGAGSDAGHWWLRAIVLVPVPALVYLLCVRVLGSPRAPGRAAAARPHGHRHPPATATAAGSARSRRSGRDPERTVPARAG